MDNNAVKVACVSHFQKPINEHKTNQKILFSTTDLLTNTHWKRSSKTPTDALCEEFADHFRRKINDIRSRLLPKQIFNVILPNKTLESFDLVDARALGRVFSRVETTSLLDPIPTLFFKRLCGFFEDHLSRFLKGAQDPTFQPGFYLIFRLFLIPFILC